MTEPRAQDEAAAAPAGFGEVRGSLRGAATIDLTTRVERIESALELGGARIDPAVADRVRVVTKRVRERLDLGVDHTVVALLGGTGSGKSSLFNAICGLDFADVGVRRPTTAEVTACVWGEGGEALLDWLDVARDRRIERESLLDGDSEAALRGLVLLDLPDHDSVEPAHRVVVDRLLPMADVLVWVVDPQKYADDALHSGYLRGLVGHEGAMVVLLNQADTVPPEQRAPLLADLERLLVEDGLTGVSVRPVSARTGDGVAEVRDDLAAAVGGPSLAARRGAAEVNDAATMLAGQLSDHAPAADRLDVGPVADALARATGLAAIADVVAAVVRGGATAVPGFAAVQPSAVELARSAWLGELTPLLPSRWASAVSDRVAPARTLAVRADAALDRVTLAARRSPGATALFLVAAALGLLAVVAAAVSFGLGLGAAEARDTATVAAAALVLAVLMVVAIVLGFRTRRSAARHRADTVLRDGRAALVEVARVSLAEPAGEVLTEHARVRELVRSARTS